MAQLLNQLYLGIDSKIIKLVAIAIVMDTVFGVIRAIKWRKFNSSFGIDGAIRKVSMILCIMFCTVVDIIIHINFIGFLPNEWLGWLNDNLNIARIGLGEFFGVLFIAYEVISILKNMTLCGLPTLRIYMTIRKFLKKYTDELPDDDEIQDLIKELEERANVKKSPSN